MVELDGLLEEAEVEQKASRLQEMEIHELILDCTQPGNPYLNQTDKHRALCRLTKKEIPKQWIIVFNQEWKLKDKVNEGG